jgi:hypothetical protein
MSSEVHFRHLFFSLHYTICENPAKSKHRCWETEGTNETGEDIPSVPAMANKAKQRRAEVHVLA